MASTRININLDQNAYITLKKTAESSGMDMSEFVRHALRVMNTLQQEKQKGKQIFIGQNDKAEKELLIP